MEDAMRHISDNGTIGVVIDGPNYANCRRGLDIRKTSFDRFLQVLIRRIGGSSQIMARPMSTIHPDDNRRGCCLHDDMVRAGFELTPEESVRGCDDLIVVSHLRRFANISHVSTLVLVSCDHYPIEQLLLIVSQRRVSDTPLKGLIVGTTEPAADGHCRIRRETINLIRRSPSLSFLELGKIREHIAAQ